MTPAATAQGSPRGVVRAVCLVAGLHPERTGPDGVTAIDKRPVDGPVTVGSLGPVGDRVADPRHHGGPEQAVYAYAEEEAEVWAAELGRPIPAGLFGENLRTAGLAVSDAVVGERWTVGTGGLTLVVTAPRIPCATFARRMGEERWVTRFTERGAVGAYLAVTVPGPVRAGDEVTVVHRPAHGVTVRALFAGEPDVCRRLLAADGDGVRLGPKVRAWVEHRAARTPDA